MPQRYNYVRTHCKVRNMDRAKFTYQHSHLQHSLGGGGTVFHHKRYETAFGDSSKRKTDHNLFWKHCLPLFSDLPKYTLKHVIKETDLIGHSYWESYSIVQHRTESYSFIQHRTAFYSIVQHCATLYSIVQHCTALGWNRLWVQFLVVSDIYHIPCS